jgi:hypothetical protein
MNSCFKGFKPKRLRKVGDVAHIKNEIYTKCWPENLEGRHHLGQQDVGGKIILKHTLDKQVGCVNTGFMQVRIRSNGGLL